MAAVLLLRLLLLPRTAVGTFAAARAPVLLLPLLLQQQLRQRRLCGSADEPN
jgi:hypothetical protein